MNRQDAPRIAILGAGPIGLEALLYARTLNLPATVYERSRVGEYLHRWGHVRLFSPFGMNVTPLGRKALQTDNPSHEFPDEGDCITGRKHLTAYLEPLSRLESLRPHIHTETEVLHVGRRGCLKGDPSGDPQRGQRPFRLIVRDATGREHVEEADVVLDCTGTYGRHRWLGDGGIPALGEVVAEQYIAYGLEDVLGEQRTYYAGMTVLVVGAGYSAATSVCALAALAEQRPETRIIWLTRGSSRSPLKRLPNDPLPERDRLAQRANEHALCAEGHVTLLNQATVEAIEPHGPRLRVSGRLADEPRTWTVDRVIANVGYTPDTDLYRELQVHECYASLGPMKLAAALSPL
ncbi:MAG: NAD(P)-binding domain-containing protein, partial [Gemmataceae bacterium]|nr:NAD(P)-binding domain-containing protein [Gemmataceae bacterium]